MIGDCVVRAVASATGVTWEEAFIKLSGKALSLADMPSSNEVWGAYLVDNGFKFKRLPDSCPYCYTIRKFANDHNKGTFVLGTGTHAVCVKDGNYIDSFDSGDKVPIYMFEKVEKGGK